MDYTQLRCPPFSNTEALMVVSTRIRVGRNLEGLPLGPGISKEQRNLVESKVSTILKELKGEHAGSYYALNSLTSK